MGPRHDRGATRSGHNHRAVSHSSQAGGRFRQPLPADHFLVDYGGHVYLRDDPEPEHLNWVLRLHQFPRPQGIPFPHPDPADRRVLFWAYLAIPVQFYWIYLEWYGLFIIFIPVYMFLLLPLRMVIIGQTEGYIRAIGTVHWGLMLTVFCLSHTAFLLILREAGSPGDHPGVGLVLFLVIMTQLNDVCQFLWGKSLGRAKILPKVSPGKTWAGFVGGVATTTVVGWQVGPFLTILDQSQSLVAGLIIGIGGFVGDVNLSALKRDLHVKDSGSLLPGHGGILDRIDSLTYTAPLFFHYVYWSFDWHTFGLSLGK